MTVPASSECTLVFLTFSKTPVRAEEWQSLFKEIHSSVPAQLRGSGLRGLPQVRFLDGGSNASEARVAETVIITERTPATLSECTEIYREDTRLAELQSKHDVEIILQPGELYSLHKTPGLAVFDMDSTLIQQEVIDELARAVGLYDKVAAITEAAMRGEAPYTDFEASLRARVALLKGVQTSIWEQLKAGTITFTPGAFELVRTLKALGWKTAVLSGGFTPLANWVKETLGLDYAYANHLVSDSGLNILTGELAPEAPIIHAQRKRELLLQLAAENHIPAERTIAVGDGSNDLLMMGAAGLGIAFNAKPKVQRAAPARLNSGSLLDVMYILGFTTDEVESLSKKQAHP